MLWLLASLERNSEHLLAAAIVEHAERTLERNIGDEKDQDAESAEIAYAQPSSFVAMTGRGASGLVLGNIDVAVGNLQPRTG